MVEHHARHPLIQQTVQQLLASEMLRTQLSWAEIVRENPALENGIHPGTSVHVRVPSWETIAALRGDIDAFEVNERRQAADIQQLEGDLMVRDAAVATERERADAAEHALANWKLSTVVLPIIAILLSAGLLFLRFRVLYQSEKGLHRRVSVR